MKNPALATAALAILAAAPAALALSGAGVSNTAPADDPGWAHVGQTSNNEGSIVYLGKYATGYWVLTAAHVTSTEIAAKFSGVDYSPVAGSGVFLTNSDMSVADLFLYRISGDSALDALTNLKLATNVPSGSVTAIGWGKGSAPLNAGPRGHGTHTVSATNINGEPVNGRASKTFFTTSSDVEFVFGDSGGAVFSKVLTGWELAGIMTAKGMIDPDGAGPLPSQFLGVSSQISVYASQINGFITPVPEPATYGLIGAGAAMAAGAVRRRRRVV